MMTKGSAKATDFIRVLIVIVWNEPSHNNPAKIADIESTTFRPVALSFLYISKNGSDTSTECIERNASKQSAERQTIGAAAKRISGLAVLATDVLCSE